MKSELAIKLDQWFESDEGRLCINGDILLFSNYEIIFKERLERAFLAGAVASEEVKAEFVMEFYKRPGGD